MSYSFKNSWNRALQFYRDHRLPVRIASVVVVVGILTLVVVGALGGQDQKAIYQTVALTRGTVKQSIGIVGTVRAVPSASLTWGTSGTVMPFTVKVGDIVKEGDVLLELQPSSLSAGVLQAQTQLISARQDLAVLESSDAEYESAAQALTDAEVSYNKARDKFSALIEVEGVSIDTIEPLIGNYYDAREALWAAKAAYQAVETLPAADVQRVDALEAVDSAQRAYNKAIDTIFTVAGFYFGQEHGSSSENTYLSYRSTKAALNEARVAWNAARNNAAEIAAAAANVQALLNTVNSARIIAPFDGTVTDLFADPGASVSSGASAIQLDNLSTMMVDVSVSEVDVNNIQVGNPVNIAFDALPKKTYQGIVTQVGNSGIDNSGVVKFNVSITLTDADQDVKPGFTAVCTIVTAESGDVLLIPVSAIHKIDDQKIVAVERNGRLIQVPVSLGAVSDTFAALKQGELVEGDLVVTNLDVLTLQGLGLK